MTGVLWHKHTRGTKATAAQTSYKERKEEKNSGGRTPNDATGMCYRAFLREQVINETFKLELEGRLRGTEGDGDR